MSVAQSSDKSLNESSALFMIIISVIFWAFAFPLIKVGLTGLSPENLAILRLFLASLIFLAFYLLRPTMFSRLNKKDIPVLFVLGFTGISVYHLGLNYGEQFVSAGAASLIIATIPIYVVILAVIFLKEHVSLKIGLGIIISLVGVVVISLWGTPETVIEINYILGALAIVLAAFVGSVYTIVGKKLLQRYNGFSLTAYAFLFGNLGLIVFVRGSLFEEVSSLSIELWAAVVFLACFPTVIAYSLWYIVLQVKSASELSVFLYITPILSTLISTLFFGEKITVYYILGGMLIIGGLYIVNKKKGKRQYVGSLRVDQG
jgi:drug/metabolite transporter (DMT)-like permease